MAIFSLRASGNWQARIRRDGWPPQSKTFPNKTDAIAWARKIEREMDTESFLPSDEAARTTLEQLAKRYREEVLPKLRARERDKYLLSRIEEEFGKYALSVITPAMLSAYRDERLKAVSAQSCLHELGMISRLYNKAIKDWKIKIPRGNPIAEVTKPSVSNERDRTLRDGEEDLLLAVLGERENPWPRAAFVLALETAGRLSELLALRWSDVDVRARVARLRGVDGGITKNGDAFRDVPLTSRAVRLLESLPRSTKGKVLPMTANALKLAWARAIARARRMHLHSRLCEQLAELGFDQVDRDREVRALIYKKRQPQPITRKLLDKLEKEDHTLVDLHFHDLRHCATTMLASQLEMHELMKVTGHKSARLVLRYYHPKAKDLALKLA
ncbi:tyrosine-type recombinase/integrase [Variovorax sp. V59]|uniref:tyrosine-type recombinase/integrase n=1 Tax=unclassified Variovorax TaxID=663243 RepID=UPI0034E840A4